MTPINNKIILFRIIIKKTLQKNYSNVFDINVLQTRPSS